MQARDDTLAEKVEVLLHLGLSEGLQGVFTVGEYESRDVLRERGLRRALREARETRNIPKESDPSVKPSVEASVDPSDKPAISTYDVRTYCTYFKIVVKTSKIVVQLLFAHA